MNKKGVSYAHFTQSAKPSATCYLHRVLGLRAARRGHRRIAERARIVTPGVVHQPGGRLAHTRWRLHDVTAFQKSTCDINEQ